MLKRVDKKQGFTVVELAVVIAVIGIIASIVIAMQKDSQWRAAEAALQSDLLNASAQLSSDNNFGSSYPASIAAADNNNGLMESDGTEFRYTYTAATNSYCLSALHEEPKVSPYHITSEDSAAEPGVCAGH